MEKKSGFLEDGRLFGGFNIPDSNGFAPRSGSELFAVRTEGYADNRVRILEYADSFAALNIP